MPETKAKTAAHGADADRAAMPLICVLLAGILGGCAVDSMGQVYRLDAFASPGGIVYRDAMQSCHGVSPDADCFGGTP